VTNNNTQTTVCEIYHNHGKAFSVTSTATYTNIFQVDMDTYKATSMDLTFQGVLQGVGGFGRYSQKLLNRDAGNIAVTSAIDLTAGQSFDVQYDVTTTAGSLYVGVKRATTAGTSLEGILTIDLSGHVKAISYS
jgi:hypothetical protein